MIFTPQALRRIGDAVQTLGRASRGLWETWLQSFSPNNDQAQTALHGLIKVEQKLKEQLSQDALNDDQRADMLNDLGYVRSIKAALLKERQAAKAAEPIE